MDKEKIKEKIENNDVYRDKAKKIYDTLSPDKKKEVQKYIDHK